MIIIPWRAASKDEFVLFHHLPKTGGSALSRALQGVYGEENYKWFNGPAGVLKELSGKTKLVAAGGHFSWNHPWAKKVRRRAAVLTILRDPVERVLSNYYYLRLRSEQSKLNNLARQYTLREIFELGLGQELQVENWVTACLSQTLSPAKRLLSAQATLEGYTFFGFQEQMDVLAILISRFLVLDHFEIPRLANSYARPTLPKKVIYEGKMVIVEQGVWVVQTVGKSTRDIGGGGATGEDNEDNESIKEDVELIENEDNSSYMCVFYLGRNKGKRKKLGKEDNCGLLSHKDRLYFVMSQTDYYDLKGNKSERVKELVLEKVNSFRDKLSERQNNVLDKILLWKDPVVSVPVSRNGIGDSRIVDSSIIDLIREHNKEDIMLYTFAKEMYESKLKVWLK